VKLRLQTDYALRVLLYLAHVDGYSAVDQMASAYGISKDHLFKVVQQLARFGYVNSRSGRSGGVRLGMPAERIRVNKVIADFEGRQGVIGCVSDPAFCRLEPGCGLRTLLMQAEQSFFETLDVSLADILGANRVEVSGGVNNLTVAGRTIPPRPQGPQGPQVGEAPPLGR